MPPAPSFQPPNAMRFGNSPRASRVVLNSKVPKRRAPLCWRGQQRAVVLRESARRVGGLARAELARSRDSSLALMSGPCHTRARLPRAAVIDNVPAPFGSPRLVSLRACSVRSGFHARRGTRQGQELEEPPGCEPEPPRHAIRARRHRRRNRARQASLLRRAREHCNVTVSSGTSVDSGRTRCASGSGARVRRTRGRASPRAQRLSCVVGAARCDQQRADPDRKPRLSGTWHDLTQGVHAPLTQATLVPAQRPGGSALAQPPPQASLSQLALLGSTLALLRWRRRRVALQDFSLVSRRAGRYH